MTTRRRRRKPQATKETTSKKEMPVRVRRQRAEQVVQASRRSGTSSNSFEVKAPVNFLPTGATLLNLACTDKCDGGFGIGRVTNIIGDSSAGKSLLALTMLAEVCKDPKYDRYKLFYDDAESGFAFNMGKMFGNRAGNRIKQPHRNNEGKPCSSDTVEDFFIKILVLLELGEPFIYVLDSLDALTSRDEQDRAQDMVKGKDKGSYKTEKPRIISEMLRVVARDIEKSESSLIIISQVREDINPMTFTKKKRSGGKALEHYCTHTIWLAKAGTIKTKGQPVGIDIKAKVSKNRATGKSREVVFPAYVSYGIDDIAGNIEAGVLLNVINKRGRTYSIDLDSVSVEGMMTKCIQQIEHRNLEKELAELVEEGWKEREAELELNRKPKYA